MSNEEVVKEDYNMYVLSDEEVAALVNSEPYDVEGGILGTWLEKPERNTVNKSSKFQPKIEYRGSHNQVANFLSAIVPSIQVPEDFELKIEIERDETEDCDTSGFLSTTLKVRMIVEKRMSPTKKIAELEAKIAALEAAGNRVSLNQ